MTGCHLGFLIGKILATFDLHVFPMLPTKFRGKRPFGSGKGAKNKFQDGSHVGHFEFPMGSILAILDLQVTPLLPTKFRVSWLFGSGEEAKIRFSRWPPFLIFDQNDFYLF